MNENLLVSLKRTLIPIIVGAVAATFLAGYVDPDALEKVLSGVISAVYYTVVRLAETKFPGAGILLGAKVQPVYEAPKD